MTLKRLEHWGLSMTEVEILKYEVDRLTKLVDDLEKRLEKQGELLENMLHPPKLEFSTPLVTQACSYEEMLEQIYNRR